MNTDVDFIGYLSPDQIALLEHWNHLIPIEMLSNGNILVLDSRYDNHGNHFGPYILNRLGELRDINKFYYHVFSTHDKVENK